MHEAVRGSEAPAMTSFCRYLAVKVLVLLEEKIKTGNNRLIVHRREADIGVQS